MSKKVIAAIDVGSHALRMKVGELSKSGKFKELETYRKIAVIGHDTFTKGKVNFQTVDKVCDILKSYKQAFDELSVTHYKAMATSAIREADNRDYIVDQIRLKTGLEIEVISNSEEQYLTHKAVKAHLESYDKIIEDGAVIVVIGAGSIQITTYKEGMLQSSQNVKMGSLRIKEAFSGIEDKVTNYHNIIEEYIATNLEGVDFFSQDETYEHIIAVGGEISVISKIIEDRKGEELDSLSLKQFNKLYKRILDMSPEDIEETFEIKKERADIILPSMMLFRQFLNRIKGERIITPHISLTDGIVQELHEELHVTNKTEEYHDDIITSAVVLAKKFHYNKSHCGLVEKNSLFLFDRLKRLHGLKSERMLLQVATILHDIGKVVSLDRHNNHSYEIIKNLEIFGLSKEKMTIIATIACYHSMIKPEITDYEMKLLTRNERAMVGKLIAIIRLADALDRSHKAKLNLYRVKIDDKILTLYCKCNMNVDTTLEEWTFEKKADYFVEVYGVTPVLKIKREFINEKE